MVQWHCALLIRHLFWLDHRQSSVDHSLCPLPVSVIFSFFFFSVSLLLKLPVFLYLLAMLASTLCLVLPNWHVNFICPLPFGIFVTASATAVLSLFFRLCHYANWIQFFSSPHSSLFFPAFTSSGRLPVPAVKRSFLGVGSTARSVCVCVPSLFLSSAASQSVCAQPEFCGDLFHLGKL